MQAKALHYSGRQNRVTYSQWFVLGIIELGKNASIKDIAKMLGMTSSAATQLVDGLVQSGYVLRQDNPKDRRAVQLALAAKGVKQFAAMKEERMNEMARLFEALSESELQTYLRLHKKITSKFLEKKS